MGGRGSTGLLVTKAHFCGDQTVENNLFYIKYTLFGKDHFNVSHFSVVGAQGGGGSPSIGYHVHSNNAVADCRIGQLGHGLWPGKLRGW